MARFDADGGLTWVKLFGGVGATTQPNDLAVGASGAVYVTGKFTGTVDFDPGPGVASRSSAGGDDIFAARLNADGTFGWASTAGAAGTDLGYSIAAAADGGAYLVGNFEATVSFGSAVLPSNGSSDAVVARLAPDGTFAWARRMGGTGMERGRGVAAFRDGTVDTVYVAGDFFSPTAEFRRPDPLPRGRRDAEPDTLRRYGLPQRFRLQARGHGGRRELRLDRRTQSPARGHHRRARRLQPHRGRARRRLHDRSV